MTWNWQQPDWPNFSWDAPRLQKAESERHWNDVAYVLGLLPHKNEEITKMIGEGCKVVEAAA